MRCQKFFSFSFFFFIKKKKRLDHAKVNTLPGPPPLSLSLTSEKGNLRKGGKKNSRPHQFLYFVVVTNLFQSSSQILHHNLETKHQKKLKKNWCKPI